MKFILSCLVLLAFIAVLSAGAGLSDALAAGLARWRKPEEPALDVEAMLDAIAQVESGGNPHAVGELGERGRCQFMEGTWRRYTNAPFLAWAPVDCEFTRKIEQRHLAALCAQLLKHGHPLEPELVAAAWRAGAGAATLHVRDDASRRVANLYWDAIVDRAGRRAEP